MSEAIVLTTRHKIKQEKLDEFESYFVEGMALVEAQKPSTVFQCGYVNNDWTEVSFIHVFPDAVAFEDHMIGAGDRSARARDFLEPMSMQIFGSPNDKVRQMFKQIEAGGVTVTYWPRNLGGFIRLAAG